MTEANGYDKLFNIPKRVKAEDVKENDTIVWNCGCNAGVSRDPYLNERGYIVIPLKPEASSCKFHLPFYDGGEDSISRAYEIDRILGSYLLVIKGDG